MRLSILLLFCIVDVISLHDHRAHHHLSLVEAKPFEQASEPQPSTAPVSLSLAPTNHRINFLGLKHDYPSDEEAKQALSNNLKAITGYDDIIVESIDEQGATWRFGGKLGSTDQDCPEQEIRQIVAKIKEPTETEFTREFKMWIDERFLKPHQVQILWLGPCGNVARKRNRIETGTGSNIIVELADKSLEELMPSTTTVAEVISVSNVSQVEATSTTNAEPKQPTTTTTEPPTQPAVETTTSQPTTTAEESSSSGSSSLENFSFPPFDFTSFENTSTATALNATFDNTTNNRTATTVKPTELQETNTTKSTVPSPETTTAAASSTTTTAATTSTSTTILQPSPTTVTSSLSSEEGAIGLAGEGESPSPHYGKYIGFCAAFLIFVAYLVCSRAYKRHGMYELHTE